MEWSPSSPSFPHPSTNALMALLTFALTRAHHHPCHRYHHRCHHSHRPHHSSSLTATHSLTHTTHQNHSAMGTVPLPAASITIVSPAQAVSSTRGLFPHLRIRVVPEVTLPASLAPPNAKGRGLEDSLKVIVRVGSKVHVSWKVEAGALPVGQRQDPEALLCKVQIAVGEWLTLVSTLCGRPLTSRIRITWPSTASTIPRPASTTAGPSSSLP